MRVKLVAALSALAIAGGLAGLVLTRDRGRPVRDDVTPLGPEAPEVTVPESPTPEPTLEPTPPPTPAPTAVRSRVLRRTTPRPVRATPRPATPEPRRTVPPFPFPTIPTDTDD